MPWWAYPMLFAAGLAAGVINVFAGGGSAITLPVLILAGLPAAVANGSNRIALIFQNVAGVANFRRKGVSDLPLSLWLALPIVPGAVLGALASVRLGDAMFRRILALVIMGIVCLVVFRRPGSRQETDPEVTPKQRGGAMLLLFFCGLYMGFIQAGVGFLLIGALSVTTRLDLVRIHAQKLAMVLVGATLALAIFISQGKVNWPAGLTTAAGNVLGAFLATHWAVKGGEVWAKRVLVAAAVVLAVWMVVV